MHHTTYESLSSSQVRICNSYEIKLLQRTMKLISNTSQLDVTLGEEIKRAGTQLICSRLIEQINKCTMKFEGELLDEDDDNWLNYKIMYMRYIHHHLHQNVWHLTMRNYAIDYLWYIV